MALWVGESKYQQQYIVYQVTYEWCVPGYHIAVYLLIPHPFDIYSATIGIIPSHKYFSWLPFPNGITLTNFLNLIKLFL